MIMIMICKSFVKQGAHFSNAVKKCKENHILTIKSWQRSTRVYMLAIDLLYKEIRL